MINRNFRPDKTHIISNYKKIKGSLRTYLLFFFSLLMIMDHANAATVESVSVTKNGQPSGGRITLSATADNNTIKGINFNPIRKIDISVKLEIPPEQVNQEATIYLVAKYQDSWYMKANDTWVQWNSDIDSLSPYIDKFTLNAIQQGVIEHHLSGLAGSFKIYFGYKINNELYYNPDPLEFTVSDGVENPPTPPTPTTPTTPTTPPTPTPNNPTAPVSNLQIVQTLEAQGLIPKLDRSPDIQGPDTNANGIRDDVEEFIANNYPSLTQQAAALQLARVFQTAILIDKSNLTDVKAISIKESRAINCIYSRFNGVAGSKPAAAVVSEIESIMSNTKARLLAYLAYAKALDGTVVGLPEGDSCE